MIRKKSFGLCEDDMGGADENGWLSNIHSASSSRSASLANSSIAQVFTRLLFVNVLWKKKETESINLDFCSIFLEENHLHVLVMLMDVIAEAYRRGLACNTIAHHYLVEPVL